MAERREEGRVESMNGFERSYTEAESAHFTRLIRTREFPEPILA